MIHNKNAAFTVVELVVVIVVVALLATFSVLGYTQVNRDATKQDVQSTLEAAVAQAKSEVRDNGELTDLLTDFNDTDTATVTYYNGSSAGNFCVEVYSKQYGDIRYFYNTEDGSSALPGTCAGGQEYDSQYTAFVYDLNLPSCVGTTVQLPVSSPSSASGSTINWGDGSSDTLSAARQAHTYATKGKYTVLYNGPINAIETNAIASDARPCLLKVGQWSDSAQPTSLSFFNSTNLTYIAEPPTSVTSFYRLFRGCPYYNQPINNWNVSHVTNMRDIFYDAYAFSQPLDNWDVSSVTTLEGAFARANSFNQNINNWDVSSVTNLRGTFSGSSMTFNQPLDNWDVSNVTTLASTFSSNLVFNQNINNWDVSNVTDLTATFGGRWGTPGAESFNQPLNNWDTSSVTQMVSTFENAELFNQDISSWDTSNVTSMYSMFSAENGDHSSTFNQPLNTWNLSNVTSTERMFADASQFNQPLNNWDVSKVTNMSMMFNGAWAFNQNINNWDVSSVTGMWRTFRATTYNQPLNNWNTANVGSMYEMFGSNSVYNQDLTGWNVANVTDVYNATGFGGSASWTQKPTFPQ